MGTHPIFESDFDCLTECRKIEYGRMPSSSHRVTTLDAQPISQKMLNGVNSVLVSASGTVKWNASGGGQPQVKSFTQHMILSMIDSNWLIVSDTVRLCNSQHRP